MSRPSSDVWIWISQWRRVQKFGKSCEAGCGSHSPLCPFSVKYLRHIMTYIFPQFLYCYILDKRVIMDFNGNLLTLCGKTYLRAFLSWIAGMAISMMSKMSAKQPGAQVFKEAGWADCEGTPSIALWHMVGNRTLTAGKILRSRYLAIMRNP